MAGKCEMPAYSNVVKTAYVPCIRHFPGALYSVAAAATAQGGPSGADTDQMGAYRVATVLRLLPALPLAPALHHYPRPAPGVAAHPQGGKEWLRRLYLPQG